MVLLILLNPLITSFNSSAFFPPIPTAKSFIKIYLTMIHIGFYSDKSSTCKKRVASGTTCPGYWIESVTYFQT